MIQRELSDDDDARAVDRYARAIRASAIQRCGRMHDVEERADAEDTRGDEAMLIRAKIVDEAPRGAKSATS